MEGLIKKKVKVDDLSGVQVDYAMTLALTLNQSKVFIGSNIHNENVVFFADYDKDRVYRPTLDWEHTGQLIENFNILIESNKDGFFSYIDFDCKRIINKSKAGNCSSIGKSRLEAACKSIIKHALGDSIYICDHLYKMLGIDEVK